MRHPMPVMPRARAALFTLLAVAPALNLSAADASAGALVVSEAWARATPTGATVTAAYFTIENRGSQPDTLVALSSTAARLAELHRTTFQNGMSRMRPAGEITLAPGSTLKAEPGGLHVMLTGLKAPLVAGTKVPLVLQFEQGGAITLQVDVRAATASGDQRRAGPGGP